MCKQQASVGSLISLLAPTSKPRSFPERLKDLNGFQRPMPSCIAILALGGADSRARRAGEEQAVARKADVSSGYRGDGCGPKEAPNKGAGEAISKGRVAPLQSTGRAPTVLIQNATYPLSKKLRNPQPRPKLGHPTCPRCRTQQHPQPSWRPHPMSLSGHAPSDK